MKLEHGDFSTLAKSYVNRPAYCNLLIDAILKNVSYNKDFKVADVGAGTGKLTRVLLEKGLDLLAVEPNDEMRKEGQIYTKDLMGGGKWFKGTGENTGLDSNSTDLIFMASSFHWTDHNKSLPEFSRVLKKDGYFCVIYNPRNIKISKLHSRIESNIEDIVPNLKRVSSGSRTNAKEWEYILTSNIEGKQYFKDCIFMQTDYEEFMSKERYIGAWDSVNDIKFQAGDRWSEVLDMIKDEIKDLDQIVVPYKMNAWLVKKV